MSEKTETQDAVAYRIRAELVCCDIYDTVQKWATEFESRGVPNALQVAMDNARVARRWHDLCYWGEASARIAEGGCPGYETEPNLCRCTCEGCRHNCSAHKEDV